MKPRAARTAANPPPSRDPRILVDTGILVAMFDRLDAHHATVVSWFASNASLLVSVVPVLTEASFFLPPRLRAALARLAASGAIELHHPDAAGYARIAQLFDKYADQNPDWADLELVWVAEQTGIARLATLDGADFNVYRINGRKRFELELLR